VIWETSQLAGEFVCLDAKRHVIERSSAGEGKRGWEQINARRARRREIEKGKRMGSYASHVIGSGKHSRAVAQCAALMRCWIRLRNAGMMARAGSGGRSFRGWLQKTEMGSCKRHRAESEKKKRNELEDGPAHYFH
jgi:hypothetical protein